MVRVKSDEITKLNGADANGVVTATRTIRVTLDPGDSVLDIATSNVFPQVGSAHPKDAKWTCQSVGGTTYEGDKPITYRFEATYKKSVGRSITFGTGEDGEELAPWELPPQNFKESFVDVEVRRDYLYDEHGNKIPFRNSAGQPLEGTAYKQMRVIEFDLNKEGEVPDNEFCRRPVINSSGEKVCGTFFMEYWGKLLPMTRQHYVVYDTDGVTVKWEYDTVHVTIQEFNWQESYLNVGKMAIFESVVGGVVKRFLAPVFRYVVTNITGSQVEYGCLDEVIAARNNHIASGGDADDFVYEQMDVELPLLPNGMLDKNAMTSGIYDEITGYGEEPGSWTRYALPKEL